MRQLASIRQAREIKAIEGADRIQMCTVDGWQCVVKVGEFQLQDLGVYFEIDSFLPAKDERYAFLSNDFTEFEGETGARLRTRKFKGQIAQGLFLPLSIFPELGDVKLDQDVTEVLGVKKWEAPIPASLGGDVKGAFPGFISKSDQERCVSGDTIVETEDGEKTVLDIVQNQYSGRVKCFNHDTNKIEFKSIIGWSEMPNDNDWLKITLKSGKTIFVTKNHKIWSETKQSYVQAFELKISDKLVVI